MRPPPVGGSPGGGPGPARLAAVRGSAGARERGARATGLPGRDAGAAIPPRIVAQVDGPVRAEDGCAVFEVGSGSHRFTV